MRFRKTLPFIILPTALVLAPSAWVQQKPLTHDQIQSLVRSGLADDSGAKLIEQHGIDFAPAEDFLQSLQAAGASEAFLKALRVTEAGAELIAAQGYSEEYGVRHLRRTVETLLEVPLSRMILSGEIAGRRGIVTDAQHGQTVLCPLSE